MTTLGWHGGGLGEGWLGTPTPPGRRRARFQTRARDHVTGVRRGGAPNWILGEVLGPLPPAWGRGGGVPQRGGESQGWCAPLRMLVLHTVLGGMG